MEDCKTAITTSPNVFTAQVASPESKPGHTAIAANTATSSSITQMTTSTCSHTSHAGRSCTCTSQSRSKGGMFEDSNLATEVHGFIPQEVESFATNMDDAIADCDYTDMQEPWYPLGQMEGVPQLRHLPKHTYVVELNPYKEPKQTIVEEPAFDYISSLAIGVISSVLVLSAHHLLI